jgi:hypothetical protein
LPDDAARQRLLALRGDLPPRDRGHSESTAMREAVLAFIAGMAGAAR